MSEPYYYFNLAVSAGAIILQLAIVAVLVISFTPRFAALHNRLAKHALLLGFGLALAATVLSLFYSEIVGFEACKLCWYQRIFMFSQVVILGLALKSNDKVFAPLYSISLSAIGALIAAYQYYGQMFNPGLLNCGLAGTVISCTQRYFVHFGYITIPMMALTSFALLIVLMWPLLRQNKTIK